jgi:hypothetical protein
LVLVLPKLDDDKLFLYAPQKLNVWWYMYFILRQHIWW